ncbi:hypothetical protein [uncultured Friedmanniella sp.]|uniref:hypothetical protein n=1 Tax=uncultured Friedmanniella sp. TaxID=335381 RepID=UPI0035CB9980
MVTRAVSPRSTVSVVSSGTGDLVRGPVVGSGAVLADVSPADDAGRLVEEVGDAEVWPPEVGEPVALAAGVGLLLAATVPPGLRTARTTSTETTTTTTTATASTSQASRGRVIVGPDTMQRP